MIESFKPGDDKKKDRQSADPRQKASWLKGGLAAGAAFLGIAGDIPPAKSVGQWDIPAIGSQSTAPGELSPEVSGFSADTAADYGQF